MANSPSTLPPTWVMTEKSFSFIKSIKMELN